MPKDKSSGGGQAGLKMPMGNSHWEKKPEDTMVADGKYATEFGNPGDLKRSVDSLASFVKKNKMKY